MTETKDKVRLDKDELIKSLQEFEFSQAEIDGIVEKAEKDGEFESKEKKDDETIDEEAAEKNKNKEDESGEEMKKAYDKVMSMKDELDKSMTEFLNKFGSAPGIKTPDTDLHKGEETEIEKSEQERLAAKKEKKRFKKAERKRLAKEKKDDINKGEKTDIEKAFETQTDVNNQILKSLEKVTETVAKIAEAPNPMKSLWGSYGKSVIEKGERVDEDGKRIINLDNKDAMTEVIEKSIDKIENEQDKQIVRSMLSNYTISNKLSFDGLNIVKKAMNIDFEK